MPCDRFSPFVWHFSDLHREHVITSIEPFKTFSKTLPWCSIYSTVYWRPFVEEGSRILLSQHQSSPFSLNGVWCFAQTSRKKLERKSEKRKSRWGTSALLWLSKKGKGQAGFNWVLNGFTFELFFPFVLRFLYSHHHHHDHPHFCPSQCFCFFFFLSFGCCWAFWSCAGLDFLPKEWE